MILDKRYRQRGPFMWLTVPFIYGMYVPLAFLDLCTCVYQAICFPIFGIQKIPRRKYFRFDRGHLPYLGTVDRLNCNYCAYANGVMGFSREVITRTEYYWCPIRNKLGGTFKEPEHHKDFAPFNDKDRLAEMIDERPT